MASAPAGRAERCTEHMKLFTKKSQPAPDLRLEALEAEYKNYRRRTQEASSCAALEAQRKTVLAFLPLYDDLDRALAAPCQDEAYRRGIELMMQNLLSILADMKVLPMQSLGKCFNPAYHEAVSHIEDKTAGEERIVQVIQTGFTMDEEVIRHAKVVVAN